MFPTKRGAGSYVSLTPWMSMLRRRLWDSTTTGLNKSVRSLTEMVDTFTKEERSWIMAQVRSKDTKPEIVVRRWLHRNGYRFRLHGKDLPGKPDIVLPKYNTAVFVHGCFWHRHEGCKYATFPASNVDYWKEKFERNAARDRKNMAMLRSAGWKTHVVWECEVKDGSFPEKLQKALQGS